jgi:hypothetical protein
MTRKSLISWNADYNRQCEFQNLERWWRVAYVFAIADVFHHVQFSDLDNGRQFCESDFGGCEIVEERSETEGHGKVEKLHGCDVVAVVGFVVMTSY